jgi:hypothetical protein
MTQKDHYTTITIPCKPYVKRFLINSFGNPADLSYDRNIYTTFRLLLSRRVHRNAKRVNFKEYGKLIYHEEVEVAINEETFQRYGFSIHRKAVIDFNLFLEAYIKNMARLFILNCQSFGMKRMEAIREFQNTFGFSEDDFPTENILQDIKRNGEKFQKRFGTAVHKKGTSVSNEH